MALLTFALPPTKMMMTFGGWSEATNRVADESQQNTTARNPINLGLSWNFLVHINKLVRVQNYQTHIRQCSCMPVNVGWLQIGNEVNV